MFPAPDQNEVAYKTATVMSKKAWRVEWLAPVMDTSHASAICISSNAIVYDVETVAN